MATTKDGAVEKFVTTYKEITMKGERELEQLQHVQRLIEHAGNPIVQRTTELAALDGKLAALTGNTCTGKVAWRDGNGDDKKSKMLIIHGTGQSCPLHGQPKGKKRIRSYIGTDPSKQAGAKHVIESESTREDLQSERDALSRCITRAVSSLGEYYTDLGYSHPAEGQQKDPKPKEGWTSQSYRQW